MTFGQSLYAQFEDVENGSHNNHESQENAAMMIGIGGWIGR
jgi:hypothetical protein